MMLLAIAKFLVITRPRGRYCFTRRHAVWSVRLYVGSSVCPESVGYRL